MMPTHYLEVVPRHDQLFTTTRRRIQRSSSTSRKATDYGAGLNLDLDGHDFFEFQGDYAHATETKAPRVTSFVSS